MKKISMVMVLTFVVFTAAPLIAQAAEDSNKEILKQAIQGAITGAVATEATKEEVAANATEKAKDKVKEKGRDKGKFVKKKSKKRPHGWDMGEKTGWGDSDVPPGLAKKDK